MLLRISLRNNGVSLLCRLLVVLFCDMHFSSLCLFSFSAFLTCWFVGIRINLLSVVCVVSTFLHFASFVNFVVSFTQHKSWVLLKSTPLLWGYLWCVWEIFLYSKLFTMLWHFNVVKKLSSGTFNIKLKRYIHWIELV